MQILILNSINVKAPDKYQLVYSDIDSEATKMSESATLIRKRIRSRRVKISCAWEQLSETELYTITDATVDEGFSVSYFNGKTTLKKEKMYVGDLSLDLVSAKETGSIWKLSCSFIAY